MNDVDGALSRGEGVTLPLSVEVPGENDDEGGMEESPEGGDLDSTRQAIL